MLAKLVTPGLKFRSVASISGYRVNGIMLVLAKSLRPERHGPELQGLSLEFACRVWACEMVVTNRERISMGLRLFVSASVALLLNHGFLTAAHGQASSSRDASKPLTVEGSLNLRSVGDLQFSPGGERLAFVVTEAAKGTGRLKHIWIYDAASGMAREVTFSGESELAPRWSLQSSALPGASGRLTPGGERFGVASVRACWPAEVYLWSL